MVLLQFPFTPSVLSLFPLSAINVPLPTSPHPTLLAHHSQLSQVGFVLSGTDAGMEFWVQNVY